MSRTGGRRRSRRIRDLDTMPVTALLRRINREDRRVAPAIGRVIPQIGRGVDMIAAALRGGGRLIYVGAGTSGRLGWLDAAEVPPTFGVEPHLVRAVVAGGVAASGKATSLREDDRAAGRQAMRRLRVGRRDIVVGIAASGTTPFTLAAVAEARRRGARTIGVTTTPNSVLARRAHHAIVPTVGEEILRGSTRMKAGTAQKLVLQMLSTAAMVRLGHVYRDQMVGVRPLNAKLRRRAREIVAAATGRTAPQAARLLAAAGGDAKVAIVMGQAGVDAKAAQRALSAAGGFVRAAVRLARRPR